MKIGVVATGVRIDEDIAARVHALAAAHTGRAVELYIHPQCFLSHGHFAGTDEARAAAFVEVANDPSYDALWFARGGYGACRIADAVLPKLNDVARGKIYLGYSDAGSLLAALYRRGFPRIAHGPMPVDVIREDGDTAVKRAIAFLADRAPDTLEPSLADNKPAAAFNMTILSQLLGTSLQPDLTDHVLMLEDLGEYMYRIDRMFFHITSNPGMRRIAGIRLGRLDPVPENTSEFGMSGEEVARFWCERSGIPYLGRADIGHDIDNRVVPFGRFR